ncbi:MAG: cupin domain-containing protein [candidate division Zixibacteria bacterium]|nr:cupin domain-containing protein [candidate division Zixibacteria bacterium]
MNAVDVNTNDIGWSNALDYPAGAEAKVMTMGGGMAPRSILLKIPPGWEMQSHSHAFTELHYVLEGSYECHHKVYTEGAFRIIPKEVKHGPFSTKTGATILIIYCSMSEK